MSDYAATHNLNGFIQNDSWKGLAVVQIVVNAAPPVVALASAKMIFKKDPSDTVATLVLTSSGVDPTIVINDAAEWDMTIPAILDFPLGEGVWHYVFKTVNVVGFKRTYFGGTLTLKLKP
jgi:hypothetical protein